MENAEVVILSYSDTINYYYLNNDKIKVYIVCDNQDGFTPLPYDRFKISIKEIDKINMILDSILAVTEEYQSPSNCLGSCLESLYDLLQIEGGRVYYTIIIIIIYYYFSLSLSLSLSFFFYYHPIL